MKKLSYYGSKQLKMLPLSTEKQLAQLLSTEAQADAVRHQSPFLKMHDQSANRVDTSNQFSD